MFAKMYVIEEGKVLNGIRLKIYAYKKYTFLGFTLSTKRLHTITYSKKDIEYLLNSVELLRRPIFVEVIQNDLNKRDSILDVLARKVSICDNVFKNKISLKYSIKDKAVVVA